MINSMTAFARGQSQGDFGQLVWEIRGVNNRYLEVNVRMPDILRQLEAEIRQQVKKHLSRGKVDLSLNYQAGIKLATSIEVNESMLQELKKAALTVQKIIPDVQPADALALLKWPGVVQTKEGDVTELEQACFNALEQGLTQLKLARQGEGVSLKQCIVDRVSVVLQHVDVVKQQIPKINASLQSKLEQKLQDLNITADTNRVEQELAYQLQRIDVAEELDRLDSHLKEVISILEKGGVVGRRLDFLMQELHREANTLGSKSVDANVSSIVVELKVLIEQMREQVQNIE